MKKVLLITLVLIMAVSVFAACTNNTAPDTATAAPADAETQAPAEDSQEPADAEDATTEEPAQDTSWEDIQAKGSFMMGLDENFPPMGFREEGGELTGFDVELAKAVAEEMGIEVELMPINWKANILELESGNIDVIWNGFTITDERKEKLLMSAPYMENDQIVVVKSGSPITTLADLEGKKVAVQDGSSAQEAIADNEEVNNAIGEQIDFTDNVTALMDVSNGQVDALVVDSIVADYYTSKKPGEYTILDESLAAEQYGIGFRKGDQSFHDELMAAMNRLIENGKFAEISNEWFGRDVSAS